MRLLSTLYGIPEACRRHLHTTFAPLLEKKAQWETPGKIAVGIFCLWHMFAVAIFAIPDNQEDWAMRHLHMGVTAAGYCQQVSSGLNFPDSLFMKLGLCSQPLTEIYKPTLWIAGPLQRFVRPYIMVTGQWQRWNLFSPDPLRRVSFYTVEVQYPAGGWHSIAEYNPRTVSSIRRASLLKTIGRMDENNNTAVLLLLAQKHCVEAHVAAGTAVRFHRRSYVIPAVDALMTTEFWKTYKPEWIEMDLAQGTCPSSL